MVLTEEVFELSRLPSESDADWSANALENLFDTACAMYREVGAALVDAAKQWTPTKPAAAGIGKGKLPRTYSLFK